MKHILLKIQFNVEAIIFRLIYTHIKDSIMLLLLCTHKLLSGLLSIIHKQPILPLGVLKIARHTLT